MDRHPHDLPDYELQRPQSEPPPDQPPRPVAPWIAAAVLVVAAAAATYVAFTKRPHPMPTSTAPQIAAAQERSRPLGGAAEAVALPPLDESDPVVRRLVRALSDHPAVAAWLATNGPIRNFAAAVTNIADGVPPAKQLSALQPAARFRALENRGRPYIDPKTYDRYTTIAGAVASVDPHGAANLYATLKPRIEEAFGELGYPNRRFDQVLEQAIVTLLRTPTPDGPLEVKRNERAFGYAFSDRRLEDLTGPQKILLRMGPQNARIVKARLREIAVALGIPPSHLPPE